MYHTAYIFGVAIPNCCRLNAWRDNKTLKQNAFAARNKLFACGNGASRVFGCSSLIFHLCYKSLQVAEIISSLVCINAPPRAVWSVKPRRASSRHCRDARFYGHTTTAMHDNEYTPPPAGYRGVVFMARHPRGLYTAVTPLLSLEVATPENKPIHSTLSSILQENPASQAALSRTQLTLHATRRKIIMSLRAWC